MKKRTFLLLSLSVLLLTSCSTIRYYAEDLQANPMTDIPVLEPYTHIDYLAGKRELVSLMRDSLSNRANERLMQVLIDDQSLPIGDVLHVDDDSIRRVIGNEMDLIAWNCPSKQDAQLTALPPVMQQFMEDNDLPYVMLIFHGGYVRSRANYSSEIAKSVGLAVLTTILTFGAAMTYSVASEQGSDMAVLIADRDKQSLAFFNRVRSEGDPLSQNHLAHQLKQVLKNYPQK